MQNEPVISIAPFLKYQSPTSKHGVYATCRNAGWFEHSNGRRCSPKPQQVYFHPQSNKPYIPERKRRSWFARLIGVKA